MILAQDTILNHYRIGHKLGSGGMADVYQATDERMGRQIAIKILPPEFARDEGNVTRFKKEVMAAAALEHANIVKVYDVGEAQWQGFTLNYYTMDLLPGGDLKQRITQGLSANEALRILRQVADALGHAHERGFVHRDIKPENILFDSAGNAVLTDLGIAKAIGSGTKMTKTGMSIGTPHYMSPEQARGLPVDGRSDLYSLGVLLYEMLTGRVPYSDGDTFAVAFAHINEPVPQLPHTLEHLQPLLDNLMAKLPEQRYLNAEALVADLWALEQGDVPTRLSPQFKSGTSQAQEDEQEHQSENIWNDRVAQGHSQSGTQGIRSGVGGAVVAMVLLAGVYLYVQNSSAPAPSLAGVGVGASGGGGASATQITAVAPSAPRTGALQINSNPPGATVYLNDQAIGQTPLRRDNLSPGEYRLRFDQAGFNVVEQRVQVVAGSVAQATGSLASATGSVQVSSNPSGAQILLNGSATSQTTPATLTNVLVGTQTITLRANGRLHAQQQVSVSRGQSVRTEFTLQPWPALSFSGLDESSTLRLVSANVAAGYPSDPQLPNTFSGSLSLPPGRYQFEANAPNKFSQTLNVELVTGTRALAFNLKDWPTLQVQTNAASPRIYQNDQPHERDVPLAPGRYLIKINAPGYRIFQTEVELEEDTVALTPSLSPLPPEEPDMALIPPGKVTIGGREVTIAYFFGISRHEVTFEQYDRFARSTGRMLPGDADWGRGTRPVINVSWSDANAYVQWLSQQTGRRYRLPSESEWEYAARAGVAGRFLTGNSLSRGAANCRDCGSSWSGTSTSPVGSFRPNEYGIFDVHGNVWEWTADCWNTSTGGIPNDGRTREGNCNQVTVRGGSWGSAAQGVALDFRNGLDKSLRNTTVGFRVAMDIN